MSDEEGLPAGRKERGRISRLSRVLIYLVAAVGCGLAVGANSPDHPWLMAVLAAAAMAGVLYVLERTLPSQGEDRP